MITRIALALALIAGCGDRAPRQRPPEPVEPPVKHHEPPAPKRHPAHEHEHGAHPHPRHVHHHHPHPHPHLDGPGTHHHPY